MYNVGMIKTTNKKWIRKTEMWVGCHIQVVTGCVNA